MKKTKKWKIIQTFTKSWQKVEYNTWLGKSADINKM